VSAPRSCVEPCRLTPQEIATHSTLRYSPRFHEPSGSGEVSPDNPHSDFVGSAILVYEKRHHV
jgi:hypothetical protein